MNMFWATLISLIVGLIIGGALGFYFTRQSDTKKFKEGSTMSEKQIRAMYKQMGRKPSEAQIRAIMKSMK